jgi:hypothetical protein
VLAALVAGVAFGTYRVVHEEPPPFRFVEDGGILWTADGEGLMGDRRTLRQEPLDPDPGADGPYMVALEGPGSVVFTHTEIELDRDAPAMRIRQLGNRDAGAPVTTDENGEVEQPPPTLRWHGWVARQPWDYERQTRATPLRWRSAAGESGVLVRPGEHLRLRTRYDVPPSRTRECETEIVDGPAAWEVMEDGGDPGGTEYAADDGDWTTLRARSERRPDDHPRVLTGQRDRMAFRTGRPGCTGGTTGGFIGAEFEPR